MESFYDRSPGEVYTIPEEEGEISSPTSGDGVTSLRKRRLVGAQSLSQEDAGSALTPLSTISYDPEQRTTNNYNNRNQNGTMLATASSSIGQERSETINGNDIGGKDSQLSRSPYRKNDLVTNENTKRVGGLDVDENRYKAFLEKNADMGGQIMKNHLQQQMKVQQQLNQQQEIQHQKQLQQQQLHQEHLQQQQAQQMQAQAQQMQAQAQAQQQAKQHLQQKMQQQQHQIHLQMQQNQQFQHQQMQLQKQSQYQEQEMNQQATNKQQSTPNTIQQQLQRNQQMQGQQNGNMQHQMIQQANKQKIQNNFQNKQIQMEASLHMQDESWGVPYDLREDMRVQQLIQQEYPLEQRQFYHQRGKPKLTEFQGDVNDDSGKHIPYQKQQQQQQQQPQQQQQQQAQNSQNKPTAGTISGMLADFSRALGLSNTSPSRPSPTDDKTETDQNQYSQDYQTKDQSQQQYQKAITQQQIQAQIRANEQFMHGTQQNQLDQQYTQQYQQQQYQQQQYQQQQLQQMQAQANSDLKTQQHQFYGLQQSLQQQAQQHLHQQQQQEAMMNQQLMQQRQKEQEYLAQAESDQKQLYQQHQQQMLHKLPEHQPMFAHNLTPQQQQMYQQHMQLQHHAQHLKKIRRSLPHSSGVDQQKQGQFQKKECSLNMLSQSQAVGSGITMQQISAAQFLSQSVPLQLINAQYVPANLITADNKLMQTTQGRLAPVSAQPILVTSSMGHQQINSVTPMGTPQSTPVGTPRGPRDGGDSSDTMSETDSQKSLRTRRKLPSIPADQEAVSFPNSKKRDRVKPKSPHDRFSRSYSPLRQYTEGGYRIASSNLMLQRPSASETNLRKVTHGPEQIPRPGSALGLLQGSSVVSSGQTIRPDYSSRDSEIASCLPPDLRHLLTSYKNPDTSYSKQAYRS